MGLIDYFISLCALGVFFSCVMWIVIVTADERHPNPTIEEENKQIMDRDRRLFQRLVIGFALVGELLSYFK